MILNTTELEKLLKEIEKDPEKVDVLLKDFKLVHAVFDKNDGIPPRFGTNFREEGPQWEKVSGLDFEAIGRILVCHLSIEHYINNLIELSTPKLFDWDNSRMTFSQKLKLVGKIAILKRNKFDTGIEILNSIRNKLSHNMLATIDVNKYEQLKGILLDYLCRDKSEADKEETLSHMSQYDTHAIIERFTSIVCALIAGYCTSLINKHEDGESYYKFVRDE